MTYRLEELDALDACYRVAKQYPGKIPALAARLGKNYATLQKKLAAHTETHQLSLDEFSSIIDMAVGAHCKDALLPLHALCWRHGGVFLHLPDAEIFEDEGFLAEVIHTAREQADVICKIDACLRDDGKIDARELRELEREFEEAMAAQATLLEMVRAKARRDAAR